MTSTDAYSLWKNVIYVANDIDFFGTPSKYI